MRVNTKIIKFLIVKPPRCICGNPDYIVRYYKKHGFIRATCTECGYDRYYNMYSGHWGPNNNEG